MKRLNNDSMCIIIVAILSMVLSGCALACCIVALCILVGAISTDQTIAFILLFAMVLLAFISYMLIDKFISKQSEWLTHMKDNGK